MGHQTKMPVIGIAAWCQTVEVWGSEMTIFQVDEAYVDRVRAAGGLPFIIPHVTDHDVAPIVERIDALILTGGMIWILQVMAL